MNHSPEPERKTNLLACQRMVGGHSPCSFKASVKSAIDNADICGNHARIEAQRIENANA